MGDETTSTAPATASAMSTAATPAAATAAAGTPAAAADPVAAFQAALQAHDSAAAIAAWDGMKAKEQKKWKPTAKVLEMFDGVGHTGLRFMREAGAKFKQSADLGAKVLAAPAPETWVTPLASQGQLEEFAKAGPRREALDDAQAAANVKMLEATAGSADTKGLFNKAYPTARDRSYDSSWLWCRAWTSDDLKRMVRAVAGVLPHQHLQSVTGGFYIGTHVIETGQTKKKELGYAFYHGGRIVMPSGSSTNEAGGDRHDMVLGGRSHEDPMNPNGLHGMTTHFDGSALHEVGHAVGDHTDGNSWALALPYTNWKKETQKTVQEKLWDPAAATAAVAAIPAKDRLSPAAARDLLTNFVKTKNIKTPKGWKKEDALKFIRDHYSTQKLRLYASAVARDDDYKFSGDNNIVDGRVYVYLSRWDNSFASYNAQAHTDKVSWYSLASPLEWFAEQYSTYYQFGPDNGQQTQAVKDKLKVLHNTKLKDGKLKAKTGGAGGGGAQAAEERGGGGREGTGSAPADVRRAPFAW